MLHIFLCSPFSSFCSIQCCIMFYLWLSFVMCTHLAEISGTFAKGAEWDVSFLGKRIFLVELRCMEWETNLSNRFVLRWQSTHHHLSHFSINKIVFVPLNNLVFPFLCFPSFFIAENTTFLYKYFVGFLY